MRKNVDAIAALGAPGLQPAPIDWERRFRAVTQTALQAQLVHRAFRPLWVNAAFAELFQFKSVAEVLSSACLLELFDPDSCACPAKRTDQSCARATYGRRLLCRRDGARFPADVYSRLVVWDGAEAASVSIVDASGEEAVLSELVASAPHGAWLCASMPVCHGAKPQRPSGPPLEVLLVESDPASRRAEAAILLSIGCRPTVARSGAQALAALAARSFDLVLLPLELPEMGGVELARRIKALPLPWAALPIAARAPRLGADVREAVADAGMDAYLPSPVTRSRLVATIAALTGSIETAELDEIEQEHEHDEPGDRGDGDHGFSAVI